jgi:hypothetical protein
VGSRITSIPCQSRQHNHFRGCIMELFFSTDKVSILSPVILISAVSIILLSFIGCIDYLPLFGFVLLLMVYFVVTSFLVN